MEIIFMLIYVITKHIRIYIYINIKAMVVYFGDRLTKVKNQTLLKARVKYKKYIKQRETI